MKDLHLPPNIKNVNFTIDNIKSIKFTTKDSDSNEYANDMINLPDSIDSFGIFLFKSAGLNSHYFNSFSTKLKSLSISCRGHPLPEIKPNVLPSSILKLSLEGTYPYALKPNVLPPRLEKFKAHQIRSTSKESFPPTIKSVTLISSNHSSISNLPPSVTKLKFLDNFSYTLDEKVEFSPNLQKLKLTCSRVIDLVLPNNLKELSIELQYLLCPIEFPDSIHTITFLYTNNYANEIVTYENAPASLTKLKMTCVSLTEVDGESIIPNTVQSLTLDSYHPITLEEIPAGIFSTNLTYLDFGQSFNDVININVLPPNLETLILGENFYRQLNPLVLPPTLKLLQIKNPNYNCKILAYPNTIISCKHLDLYYTPTQYQDHPDQLYVLRLPTGFSAPLSQLSLNDKSNLHYLHLGDYAQSIQQSDLPTLNNIKTLEIINNENQVINLDLFRNLETIIIHSEFKLIFPKIITKVDNNNNYNYFNLKDIIIYSKFNDYLKFIDFNFIHLVKHYKLNKN